MTEAEGRVTVEWYAQAVTVFIFLFILKARNIKVNK